MYSKIFQLKKGNIMQKMHLNYNDSFSLFQTLTTSSQVVETEENVAS